MTKNSEKARNGFARRVAIRTLAGVLTLAVAYLAVHFGVPGLLGRLFTHRERITEVIVEERLEAIGELATYSMVYSGHTEVENARQVLGVSIPGTKHSVKITYSGTVSAGYEIARIRAAVDPDAGVIRLALPEVKVISNEIDEDSLQYEQRNNIFNPIKGDAAANYLEDIRKKELEKAVEMGLYDKARENAEAIIRENLAQFAGYEVVFE